MNERLLKFFDPNRSLPLFLLGTFDVALVIQFIIDWSNEPGRWQGNHTVMVYGLIVTLFALGVLWVQQRPKRVYLLEEQKPRKRRGLIILVSEHKAAAPDAITYHLGELTHCWLIATSASATVAASLEADFVGTGIDIKQGTPYRVLHDDYASTYRLVSRILLEEAPTAHLGAADIIADITGGTKPMTSGMVMACMAAQCPMQYMVTEKDAQGRAKEGAVALPIRLATTFVPPKERDSNE